MPSAGIEPANANATAIYMPVLRSRLSDNTIAIKEEEESFLH